MKELILVRHAKSSWDNPDWTDFNRPLNKRGLADAPFMANLATKWEFKPQMIISSTANRALTTSKIFAEAFGLPSESFIEDYNIYEKGPKYIISKLRSLDNSLSKVMLFGHNPDMTSLASYFTGQYFDNVPTCGMVHIKFDFDDWDNIETTNGELVRYEFPKKYPNR
jgi:phosphohistidine phosphatase